jgi:hypothetical protein
MTGTLYEDLCAFISCSVLLRMRNVSERSCIENKKHILCSVANFFFLENRAVYEIMWGKYSRGRHATVDDIIRRMRIEC